ncbi:hypothetical protein [uncultured Anaerococcus sp.]|uniref:hypothetical protein n=1 Tax=uncultured Anaerococcus sp. TaxID=293428 RepID=UPI0025F94F40|nr:hypothetical protein [uncultured Anaerococcus sp.]
MKFIIDKKATAYLDKKEIDQIYIHPDLNSKESCCGIATVDFIVTSKLIGNIDSYKKYSYRDKEIYVNPNFFSFVSDDIEIEISAFGFGNFKKLYIKNEINTIER